jgi:DDE superfamily endonuclease
MWQMIPSLQVVVDALAPAFTQPSFHTHCQLFLAWVMNLGSHTLFRVCENVHPEHLHDHTKRHDFDAFYNFFGRSAWSPSALAYRVACLIVSRLPLFLGLTLLVDDTLTHKRGRTVWGMGWFRDAVASTKKRVATASGHNWVVVALAIRIPFTDCPILALPLLARLHRKGQASCPQLARQMLEEILSWWPARRVTLLGDGGYAAKELLKDLDGRVAFVGRIKGNAAVHDPVVPPSKTKKRGPKPKKGPRLDSPKQAAARADRKRCREGAGVWRTVAVCAYGKEREFQVLRYQAVWPTVLGLRPILIVVVRDPSGQMRDCYLFTTELQQTAEWVIARFAWRWSIELLFRASKQILDVEAPQQRSQGSVGKVTPWVWLVQSVIMVWYLTDGRQTPEAKELREVLGDWDSEWSLRHMLRVLRRVILNVGINLNSSDPNHQQEFTETLKNWVNLAA